MTKYVIPADWHKASAKVNDTIHAWILRFMCVVPNMKFHWLLSVLWREKEKKSQDRSDSLQVFGAQRVVMWSAKCVSVLQKQQHMILITCCCHGCCVPYVLCIPSKLLPVRAPKMG